MKRFRTMVVACGLATLAGGVRADRGPSPWAGYVPNDWLAFVASRTYPASLFHVKEDIPAVIVFRDGRILWRDEEVRWIERNDPEMWREGKVDTRALASLVVNAQRMGFFTKREMYTGPSHMHSGMEYVGLSVGAQTRVVGFRHLGDRSVRIATAVHDAILALKPRESKRHDPQTIVVRFDPPGVCGVADAGPGVDWPLMDIPNPKPARFYFYTGRDARAVIAALARSARVRFGDRSFCARWTPAIGIPPQTFDWTSR